MVTQMRYHDGTADKHGGHPPDCRRGVHPAQHHEAVRQRPEPCIVLQLNRLVTPPPAPHHYITSDE